MFLLRSSRDASTTARLSGRPAEPGVPAADADAAADGDVADDGAPAPAGLPLTLVVFNGFRVVVAVHGDIGNHEGVSACTPGRAAVHATH